MCTCISLGDIFVFLQFYTNLSVLPTCAMTVTARIPALCAFEVKLVATKITCLPASTCEDS